MPKWVECIDLMGISDPIVMMLSLLNVRGMVPFVGFGRRVMMRVHPLQRGACSVAMRGRVESEVMLMIARTLAVFTCALARVALADPADGATDGGVAPVTPRALTNWVLDAYPDRVMDWGISPTRTYIAVGVAQAPMNEIGPTPRMTLIVHRWPDPEGRVVARDVRAWTWACGTDGLWYSVDSGHTAFVTAEDGRLVARVDIGRVSALFPSGPEEVIANSGGERAIRLFIRKSKLSTRTSALPWPTIHMAVTSAGEIELLSDEEGGVRWQSFPHGQLQQKELNARILAVQTCVDSATVLVFERQSGEFGLWGGPRRNLSDPIVMAGSNDETWLLRHEHARVVASYTEAHVWNVVVEGPSGFYTAISVGEDGAISRELVRSPQ